MKFSIVILYYNRYEYLVQLVNRLILFTKDDAEIIIVDNNSSINAINDFTNHNITYLRLDNNYGAVARNRGIELSKGEFVICLDDDIVGISESDLDNLVNKFDDPKIAAICFKVLDPATGNVVNWIHHYNKYKFTNKTFYTNEITEGAVCFRKKILDEVGLYYDKYFISHEGPDLACRIINNNYDIIYTPDIIVMHYHSSICRDNWRRYYYDTRNLLWLCLRNYPALYAMKKLCFGFISMFVYSVRDGFAKYWLKGILDGLIALPEIIEGRCVLTKPALTKIKSYESNNSNFFILIKDRLFRKNVRI